MTRVLGDPIHEQARLLRLHRRRDPFFDPPEFLTPTEDFFKPNKHDIDEGNRRKREPGVSVFDHALTTPDEARVIRNCFSSSADFNGAPVYELTVMK